MYRFFIRLCLLSTVITAVVIGSNLSVQAQEVPLKFRAGFGPSLPMYDPGPGAENKIGWTGIGALEYGMHPNVGLFIEGYYADHGVDVDVSGSGEGITISFGGVSGSVSALGANAGILLQGSSSPALYGFAGAGFGQAKVEVSFLGADFSEDRTGLSIAVGAGIRFPVNDRINVYVEGRYAHLFVEEFEDEDPINFLPVTAGLVFSF